MTKDDNKQQKTTTLKDRYEYGYKYKKDKHKDKINNNIL